MSIRMQISLPSIAIFLTGTSHIFTQDRESLPTAFTILLRQTKTDKSQNTLSPDTEANLSLAPPWYQPRSELLLSLKSTKPTHNNNTNNLTQERKHARWVSYGGILYKVPPPPSPRPVRHPRCPKDGTKKTCRICHDAPSLQARLANTDFSVASLESLHSDLFLVHDLLRKIVGENGQEPDPHDLATFYGSRVFKKGHAKQYEALLSYRTQIWNIVNKLPYPSNQRLTLSNLPHDIYVKIIGHIMEPYRLGFNDAFLYNPSGGLVTMKAMRLTNRRLCDTATPYLFSRVDLEISQASLGRLENIAWHPTISPLVRQIELRLPVYHQTLATDIYKFTRHALDILRRELNARNKARDYDDLFNFEGAYSSDRLQWERIIAENTTEEGSQSLFESDRLLQPAFIKYRQGFLEERELRKDDSFVEKVRILVKGLPNLEQLVIVDRSSDYEQLHVRKPEESRDSFNKHIEGPAWALQTARKLPTDHDVLRLISAPTQWGGSQHLGRCILGDNTRTMYNFLTILGCEGVKLRGLFIDISAPCQFSNLRCSSLAERALCKLTEGLEYFRLDVKCAPDQPSFLPDFWPHREVSDLEDLGTFIDSLLQSRKLKKVSMCLRALHAESRAKSWHEKAPSNWPEVRERYLDYVLLRSFQLGLILEQKRPEVSLSLVDCYMDFGYRPKFGLLPRTIVEHWRECTAWMREAD